MTKMLLASFLALASVACVIAPAHAQTVGGTLGIFFDNGGTLEQAGSTGAVPFDIVVMMDATEQSSAAEWVMTELLLTDPGVFKLGTTKINNTPLELGDNARGEYLIAFQGCVAAGINELVRVQYGDFGGIMGKDRWMTFRGFSTVIGEDSQISSFGGEPGYVDCAQNKFLLGKTPWVFPTVDPLKLPGVTSADGGCMLNALVTPNETASMGALKSRF